MKKWHAVMILTAMMVLMVSIGMAAAGDLMIDKPIDSITFLPDKNGNTFGRAIVQMDFETEGVKYSKGVPVMAYAEKVDILRSYSAGDQLRVIASPRVYQGRTSYTIQAFIRD